MDQDQENDGQTGDATGDEEEEKVGEKEPKPELSAMAKRKEELRKNREKLQKLKGNIGTRAKKDDENAKEEEPEEEIVVRDEFVASGARDKRIKIWNAKRGM